MTTLLSLLAMTIVLYGVSILIREYNVLVFTQFRFRYYALRDELAMHVVRGELPEDSWEYRHIVAAINYHISAVETMSITEVVRLLIQYHTSEDGRRNARHLVKRVDDPVITDLLMRYLGTTQDLLRRNSRCQIALVRIGKRLFGPAARQGRHEIVVNPNEALNEIEQNKTELRAARHAGLHCPA
ncbi:MAG: hypothetical protein J5X22_21045 [Candidatus Accumulibacter sp.]|uniref:hypothetical protein n=1 Tax=Accumulibacter sp. TaxID=2053492 RepID=UPI001AC8A8B3|nr:hypothetical protein [Accumulibacter sp.]MBN8516642.1 hypothetical protein [Accumulibacter sp.]MBO3712882.1 hypothetical protein [Accumulibacter sp.]